MKYFLFNIILLLGITANSQTMVNSKEILVPFCNAENKWGFMSSTTKQVVVAPKYDNVAVEKMGVLKVAYYNVEYLTLDTKFLYGILDQNGNELLPCIFTNIEVGKLYSSVIPDNLIVASNTAGMGVYDIQLKNWIVPQDYIKNGNLILCGKNGLLCNNNEFFFEGQKYAVPTGYEVLWVDMKNHWFPIIKDELKKGIAKWTGEIIIQANYSNVQSAGKTVKRIIANKPDFDLNTPISSLRLINKLKNNSEKKNGNISEIFDINGKLLKSIKGRYDIFATDDSDKATFTQNGVNKEIDLVSLKITDIDPKTGKK